MLVAPEGYGLTSRTLDINPWSNRLYLSYHPVVTSRQQPNRGKPNRRIRKRRKETLPGLKRIPVTQQIPSTTDSSTTEPITAEDVRQEVTEAAEATKQFATQKKDEYVQKLDDQLKQMDERIDELKSKGEELAGDAKEQWQDSLADLKQQPQEYQQKYDELTEAGGDAWQEMRQGIEQAWKDLQQATDDAAKQFEDNSSPDESK